MHMVQKRTSDFCDIIFNNSDMNLFNSDSRGTRGPCTYMQHIRGLSFLWHHHVHH